MPLIAFVLWCFIGMIFLGLSRIKVPHDTLAGKENPVEAWGAWTIMLVCWPITILNRKKFALYGALKDKDNPSWLSQS